VAARKQTQKEELFGKRNVTQNMRRKENPGKRHSGRGKEIKGGLLGADGG